MYLKKLEVQGYKSFANKIYLTFDEGITAIVGPNGSGKSNIADAIRWVLGEQSYSTLRGKKTEDMIFSGSDGRARLGMAVATLILDNSDRWLPVDFSEVTIARRAHRSGENEYHLNGSRVRLKDINELLAKGGLRRQTYTVIGQGTIDRVLSLHADERRKLFEEAAGITFHRENRAKTLGQLETTRANLLRLNDIVKEIEPRLKRLERQAQRAEEYSKLKLHLNGLLRVWYGYRWGWSQQLLGESKANLQASEAAVQTKRTQLKQLEQQISQTRTEQTELRAKLGTWYGENNRLHSQAETIQRDLAVNRERTAQYTAQREELLEEIESLTTHLAEQKEQSTHLETRLKEIAQELQEAESVKEAAQKRLDEHQSQRRDILKQQAAAEKQVRETTHHLTQRQTRLVQWAERRDSLLEEQEDCQSEISRLTKEQDQLETTRLKLKAEIASLEIEIQQLVEQQKEQRQIVIQLNQKADSLQVQLDRLSREEDKFKTRLEMLGRLRREMTGYYSGVRTILQAKAKSKLSGIIGPVSQVLKVPADLEVALSTALGSRLQNVVVETFAEAETAIAYLKKTRRGRATLLPLDTIRPQRPLNVPDTPGVIGLAAELVDVEERLRPIAEQTLNRILIVEDLAAARRAFERLNGGFQIVTREGEIVRSGGSVTGGKESRNEQGTFLAREREWRELPKQIAQLNHSQKELIHQLDQNRDEAATIQEKIQSLTNEQQQKDARLKEVQSVSTKIHRSLEQVGDSIGWQQELQSRAEQELNQLDHRQAEAEREIAELEQTQQAAEESVRELTQKVEALSAENLLDKLGQAKNVVAAIQERQKSEQAIWKNMQSSQRQLRSQIEQKENRCERLATESGSLKSQQDDLQRKLTDFKQQQAQFEQQIEETEQRLTQLEKNLTQREKDEHTVRQKLQQLEASHSRISLEAARRQDELDNLQSQIQNDLGMVNLELLEEQVGQPLLPIQAMVSNLPVVEVLPEGVEEDVKRLKIQVRRLGSINADAPQEYTELKERYDFLVGQMADLEAAAADLREVITKLDTAMEEAFSETFQQVSQEFRQYFKKLFGGGEAQLILTDPDNLIESGVEIVARPPGKRLQSMALLSGGERALTAQALIFSLLKISPTPFVIFDEVDAMLDEANIDRFRDVLLSLAKEIQFIVITHNRKTMEAADTLYGVSMNKNSVSTIISRKLEEWAEEEAKDGKSRPKTKVNSHVS